MLKNRGPRCGSFDQAGPVPGQHRQDSAVNVIAIAAAACILLLFGCAGLGVQNLLLRRALRKRGRIVPASSPSRPSAEDPALRHMRNAVHELRAIGIRLHGAGEDAAHEASHASADLFELADDLHECCAQGGAPRTLSEEEIHLGGAVDDAVRELACGGARQWRIALDLQAARLRADRHALRHMLRRAVAMAARHTTEEACIDIALRPADDGVALAIAGEGTAPRGQEGRAEARMAMVGQLMLAHGGRLEVGAEQGAIRIALVFPAQRLHQVSSDPGRAPEGRGRARAKPRPGQTAKSDVAEEMAA
jgi:hypothetical protein